MATETYTADSPDNKELHILSGASLAFIGEGGNLLVSRERIGDAIELLTTLLDIADRDPDHEEPGLEDSFMAHPANGPGCPVADVDFGIDDERHDDDDPKEDDDPGGGNVTDEPHDGYTEDGL